MDGFPVSTNTYPKSAKHDLPYIATYLLLLEGRLAWIGFPSRVMLTVPDNVIGNTLLAVVVQIVICGSCICELRKMINDYCGKE